MIKRNLKSVFLLCSLFFVLSSLFSVLSSCSSPDQEDLEFDMSALEPFWEIMDLLHADIEPADALWDQLFSTPGYAELTNREFPVKWMKSYMRMGVMPSQQALHQEWVSKNYWDTVFAVHMRTVYQNREVLSSFTQVINDPEFIQDALDLSAEYWEDNDIPEGIPPIAFLFFSRDARGYDPVIIDLMYASEKYKKGGLKELLAHEFHHYFREKKLSFHYPEETNPDYTVLHTLDQIHLEGLADQIDKTHSLANPYYAKLNSRYQQNLIKTPSDMHKLDSLLSLYPEAQDSIRVDLASQIERCARNSGHPMGYYMASTIWKSKSKEAVYQEIGNPFKFFERYNVCAQTSPLDLPVFSVSAMAALSHLKEAYDK